MFVVLSYCLISTDMTDIIVLLHYLCMCIVMSFNPAFKPSIILMYPQNVTSWGINQKTFLLTPLAALFYPYSQNGAHRPLLMRLR